MFFYVWCFCLSFVMLLFFSTMVLLFVHWCCCFLHIGAITFCSLVLLLFVCWCCYFYLLCCCSSYIDATIHFTWCCSSFCLMKCEVMEFLICIRKIVPTYKFSFIYIHFLSIRKFEKFNNQVVKTRCENWLLLYMWKLPHLRLGWV